MSPLNPDDLRDGVAYADRWLDHQQQSLEVAGMTAAIRCDDRLLFSRGYGFADLEQRTPMTPQHIFRIASHSKTFTATAVMQLAEAGKLRLDDPLGSHIPWLRNHEKLGRRTVRQVMNHAGGIVRDGNESDFWQLDGDFPDAARLQRLVEDGGDVLPPNKTFKYSNIGYSLLGLVVESASGMPYNQYVAKQIVERLGLHDTGPETDAHARERLATGYTPRRHPLPQVPIPDVSTGAMSSATGFYSTAEDLCRYASAHFLGNEELLSDASKREMHQPYWEVEQGEGHYGLGFAVQTIGERRVVGHGGGFPGHATRTWFDPEDRLAVVILTNETGGPAGVLAAGVIKILDFALSRKPEKGEERSRDLDAYTGRFVSLWGVTDFARFGNALFELTPAADDPVKFATELEVVDEDTLRISKTNGYASPGETIRYVRDASGRVTRIISGGDSSYPLEEYEGIRRKVLAAKAGS